MTDRAKPERTKGEARAYSMGYAAGRKRQVADISREEQLRERKAFAEKVFLSVLPSAMLAQNWSIGEQKITTTEQRIELALRWAKHATNRRYEL